MATQVVSEKFVGQYHGVIPPQLLPAGWIAGGKNVRKVSQGGGWKPRKGCEFHNNTTVLESGAAVKSLHYYKNPFSGDEHFMAQCNSKLLTESAQNKLPPTQDASYGTSLGVTVGTTPGFSAQVGEWWFYADGTARPVVWGGTTPRVRGLFVYDDSEVAVSDYSRPVTDGRSDTYAVVLEAAADYFVILTEEPISGVTLDLGSSVNLNSVTLTVSAWRSGSWTAVSSLSDGTASGGATLAQDGTVSWTASSLDLMRSYLGLQGYAYKFTWSGALSGSVYVISATVTQAATEMTNKWNGVMSWVTGTRFYDQSAGEFIEYLGKLTNESSSMYADLSDATTSDFLYVKCPEPAAIFGIGVVDGYGNTNAAAIDQIDYWNGSAWTAITTNLTDGTKDSGGTKSFAHTGTLAFDASAITPQRRLLGSDLIPGYWYRISWAAALSSSVRIYALAYGAYGETMPAYNGCVEFKGRLFVWGDPEYPNRLRFSAADAPTCFCGADSGYTDVFGDMSPILCAVPFYNELIVFKERGVWLLEGYSPATFGTLKITNSVGLASPKSVIVAEVGFPAAHRDEPMTVAIWQDVDGVYTFDGRKTKKESYPVDNYFNPESSDCVPATSIRSLQALNDVINNEYHLFLPSTELVFNYVTAEWFPIWEREVALATGLSFRASDNREYAYGASSNGWIMRIEADAKDINTSQEEIPIEHSIKTRAIAVDKEGKAIRFALRRLLAELKAQSAGSITTKTFRDLATSGTTQSTPQAMSMVESGYSVTVPHLTMSIENCLCFEVEFSLDVVDQEMEIYSFTYEISGKGLSEQ